MKTNSNIQKSIHNSRSIGLIVLALLFGSLQMWGVSIAYDFSIDADNPGNANDWFSDDIGVHASWSATKGGSNNPKYYTTGKGLRIYNGGKFTVSSDINMSSITLTFSGASYTFSTANTNVTQTVEPNAKSYEWSVGRTCRLQRVEITFASGGCSAIDVTGGSAVTLPAGSTTYNANDWGRAGVRNSGYPASTTVYSVGTSGYCVSMTNVYDATTASGLQFKASTGVLQISDIVSTYGIDVEFSCAGANGFKAELTGASDQTGVTGTVTISTTRTTATLTISKNTATSGTLTYIKITPKTASCANTVTVSDGGSSTHGSITSITTSPVATCSATAADRQVSIVVTPSNGYTAPENLSVGTKTGTVTSTKVSRTDNLNGTFTFVYRYNQNDNGTISYNAACVAKTYTISLNDQTPTTAASPSSITATFDSNTGLIGTVVTTLPTKTAYTFGGYYTETGGSGTQIIAADGTVVASAGGGSTYTDASKNWKYANDLVVYAYWIAKSLTNYRTTCSNIDITLTQTDGTSTPLYITSAAGQKVKAIRTLSLTVTGASGTQDVTLSGTDLLFYTTDGTQITGDDVLKTTSGSLEATDIVVAYAPSAYVDENFATPSITVTCDGNTKTFNGLVTGRCLPDEFVIAAKAGSEWVALTAKITGSGTQDAMPIRVDNTTTPTKASVAMNTSEYQLLGLPTTNSRYASNGIAVHLYSTQSTKVLNASTSSATKTHINTYATHANAATSSSCLYYEWKLISSDLVHYTVTNSNENASLVNNLVLGYSTESGKWGMYTSDKANQDIFLLPITEVLTDMDVEVMEWGTSSMVLRFAETPPSSTIKVTLGGSTSDAKTLTNINSGSTSDLYKVEGLTLSGNNCEVMQITDGSDATKGALIRKPILVNTTSAVGSDYRTALTDEVCASCDIVILNGGKLTADQDKDDHTSFANIYVYPGGKLVLDGYSLGAKQQVYARGGYSWLNLSTYALPELYIKGTIKFNGSAKIIYDYYIQNYKYYQFCLPYTVALNKVTDEADVADFPAWIKHYDGSLRAANSSATSWAWYNGTNFEAGVGYIVAAKPRQVTAVKERPLSIIRFPLTNNAFSGTSTADYGEAQKSVATTAHGIAGYNANPRTVTANNVGWNFVGNPYMATWKGDIGHNQLVENKPDGTHWDGSYKWVDAATKYITVMSAESGHDYEQYVASNTELKPFFPFYFQETASGGSGTLTFTLGNRIKKAPTRMRTPEPREAFVQIDIERNSSTDQTGFLISDKYSNDIDFDDMEKQFGSSTSTPKVWLMHDDMRMAFEAMTEIRAAGFTPLGYRAPENGDYVLSINSGSNLDDVAAVYLNDNVENVQNYNLLEDAYEFSSDAAVYNDTRFTVRIVMKENTATGLDELQGTDLDKPQKFLHEGRMYIIYKGFIWDATGRKVREINK